MMILRQQRSSPFFVAPAPDKKIVAAAVEGPRRILVNVTVERSLGAVMVVISSEKTVGDLIGAALEIYAGEKRRPFLAETDPKRFELHYSQFCLDSLEDDEKLKDLVSRNFFMCTKAVKSSCSKEAKIKQTNTNTNHNSPFLFAWTSLLDFLM